MTPPAHLTPEQVESLRGIVLRAARHCDACSRQEATVRLVLPDGTDALACDRSCCRARDVCSRCRALEYAGAVAIADDLPEAAAVRWALT